MMQGIIPNLAPCELRRILSNIPATPAQVAKWLDVSERSVLRWLAGDCAPRAVLMLLWLCSTEGRYQFNVTMGNELRMTYGQFAAEQLRNDRLQGQMKKLLALADTGAANDPFCTGPSGPPGGSFPGRPHWSGSARNALARRYAARE